MERRQLRARLHGFLSACTKVSQFAHLSLALVAHPYATFNGTLRAECLDAHWFATLEEAKEKIEAWRKEYNESRPHRALGERTPNEFAHEVAASRDFMESQRAENSP